MTSNGADDLVAQLDAEVQYETLRELANHLAGLLYARERFAPADAQARWRDEHRAVRARVADIEPGTAEVRRALDELSARLRELRADNDR